MKKTGTIFAIFFILFNDAFSEDWVKPKPNSGLIEVVREILNDEPEVSRMLFSTFEFEKEGHSPFIWLENVKSPLQGERIGPFSMYAKLKGDDGPTQYKVIIFTNEIYLDGSGKAVDRKNAQKLKRIFQSLSLQKIDLPDPKLMGRWRSSIIQGPFAQIYKSMEWTFHNDRRHVSKIKYFESNKSEDTSEKFYFDTIEDDLIIGDREKNLYFQYKYKFENNNLIVEIKDPDGNIYIKIVFERSGL